MYTEGTVPFVYDLYGLTQEEREAIGYIDFHNNGEETDDDE